MSEPIYFGPPPGMSVYSALLALYMHYAVINSPTPEIINSMDSLNFFTMCNESPNLLNHISRAEIELIFLQHKKSLERQINFETFLGILFDCSKKIYYDEDPKQALSKFFSIYIFSLFEQPSSTSYITEQIYHELSS